MAVEKSIFLADLTVSGVFLPLILISEPWLYSGWMGHQILSNFLFWNVEIRSLVPKLWSFYRRGLYLTSQLCPSLFFSRRIFLCKQIYIITYYPWAGDPLPNDWLIIKIRQSLDPFWASPKFMPHNEDDFTQKMKTTSAIKWMQFYPKKEDDLTQKLRRPHSKLKMTSP